MGLRERPASGGPSRASRVKSESCATVDGEGEVLLCGHERLLDSNVRSKWYAPAERQARRLTRIVLPSVRSPRKDAIMMPGTRSEVGQRISEARMGKGRAVRRPNEIVLQQAVREFRLRAYRKDLL